MAPAPEEARGVRPKGAWPALHPEPDWALRRYRVHVLDVRRDHSLLLDGRSIAGSDLPARFRAMHPSSAALDEWTGYIAPRPGAGGCAGRQERSSGGWSRPKAEYFDFIHTLLPTALPLKEFYEQYYQLCMKAIPFPSAVSFLRKFPWREIPSVVANGMHWYRRLRTAHRDYDAIVWMFWRGLRICPGLSALLRSLARDSTASAVARPPAVSWVRYKEQAGRRARPAGLPDPVLEAKTKLGGGNWDLTAAELCG